MIISCTAEAEGADLICWTAMHAVVCACMRAYVRAMWGGGGGWGGEGGGTHQRSSHRLGKRGLADPGGPHEGQDGRRGVRTPQPPHRQVLHDALLHLRPRPSSLRVHCGDCRGARLARQLIPVLEQSARLMLH